ncbi:MAG: ornithine cyclodeaminase family protein [Phototrophicales bacterium]|nr:MAG: ornithine cyclodeaminase family protein [Phototrophicales bacterium]
MRVLTAENIREAIDMDDAIDSVRAGYIALSKGRATVPIRGVMSVNDAVTLTMPAYVHGDPVSVIKVVSVYPSNVDAGLPAINGMVLVLNAWTGIPIALIHGAALTALRTGAGSGVATDLLARPEASILGVLGAGPQAYTQIEAVCAVREISEIRVYSPNSATVFAKALRKMYDVKIVRARSAHKALEGADVIVAATNSHKPVVRKKDVMPGTHINGVGSFKPTMQEVAAEVVLQSKIVVDHRESVWEEAGDLIIPRDAGLLTEDDVYAEIGEIAAGDMPGRTSAKEITFFKSVGNAVQDAVVAGRIAAIAEQRGLGVEVTI